MTARFPMRGYVVVGLCTLLGASAASFGQASLKAGSLYVASSWQGVPDQGYDDESNSDTVSYPSTFYSQATSSNPLSVATCNMFDLNQGGHTIQNDVAMNWAGTVEGLRHFTLEATLDQVFELSQDCDWTRFLSQDPVSPYSYYKLEDLTHGSAAIDLLSVGAGQLQAGEYRLTMHMAGAWDFDGLQFLHSNSMSMTFSAVPAPGAAALATAAALAALRRARQNPAS